MRKWRFSIASLLLLTMFVAVSLSPVNQNTAMQIWFSIDTSDAPSGGVFISGSGISHQIPYNYGDTWFSRVGQIKSSIFPKPQSAMKVMKPIIIEEQEEEVLLNGAEDTSK